MIKPKNLKKAIKRARNNQSDIVVSDEVKYDPAMFNPEKHELAKETLSQIQIPKTR